jgi:hypothetical protein
MSVGGNFVKWPVRNLDPYTRRLQAGFHKERGEFAESNSRYDMSSYVSEVSAAVEANGLEHPETCEIGNEGYAFRIAREAATNNARRVNIALGCIAASGVVAIMDLLNR